MYSYDAMRVDLSWAESSNIAEVMMVLVVSWGAIKHRQTREGEPAKLQMKIKLSSSCCCYCLSYTPISL